MAFVSVGAQTDGTATIPYGAGATGDLLILVWHSDTSTDVLPVSAGWSSKISAANFGGHNFGLMTSTAPSASAGSATFTGVTVGNWFDTFILRYNLANATQFDVVAAQVSMSGPNVATTALTAVLGGIEIAAIDCDAGIGTTTAPTGWTVRLPGNNNNWYCAEKNTPIAAGASTGTQAFVTPGGNTAILHFIIAPTGGGTPSLVPAGLGAGATIGAAGALTQHQALVVANLSAGATVAPVTLTPGGALAPAGLAAGATIGPVALTQHFVLSGVANLAAGASVGAVVLAGLTTPDPPTVVRPSGAFGFAGSVALSWTAPTTGGTPTDYGVQYSSDNGGTWTTYAHAASTTPSLTLTGLTVGTRYLFRVRSHNGSGDSAYVVSEWGSTPHAAAAAQTPPGLTTQTSAPWDLDIDDGVDDGDFKYAWTGAGVRIYVIDLPMRTSHNEFSGRVATGFACGDFPTNTDLGTGVGAHGTSCASIALGTTFGVAKGATLVPLTCFRSTTSGGWSGSTPDAADFNACIDWIIANHPPGTPGVVSSSQILYQDGTADQTSSTAKVAALVASGLCYVQAEGNDSQNPRNYGIIPMPGMLYVSGVQTDGTSWYTASNVSATTPDVLAGSVSVPCANNGSDSATTTFTGTSQATPQVAGAIAMWLQANPSLTPVQLTDMVKAASSKGLITGLPSGVANRRLNINADVPPVAYALTGVAGLSAGATIAAAPLTQHQALTGVAGLSAGATVGVVAVTQHQALTGVAGLGAGATIGPVALTAHQVLAVAGLAAGATIGPVTLTQHQALAVANLAAAATIAAAPLVQHQTLAGVAGLGAAATVGAVVLTPGGSGLNPAILSAGATIESVVLVQHYAPLTVAGLAAGATIGPAVLVQHQTLTVDGLAAAASIGAPTLLQHQLLAVADLAAAATISAPALTQHQALAVADLIAAATIGAAGALLQHQVLTVAGLGAGSTIGAVVLGLPGQIGAANMAAGTSIESVTLVQHYAPLTVAGLAAAATVGPAALVQHQALTVASLAAGASLTPVTLAQGIALVVANLSSGATIAPAGALLQHQALQVDGLAAGATLGAPALTQHQVLTAVAGILSAASVGAVVLSSAGVHTVYVGTVPLVAIMLGGTPVIGVFVGSTRVWGG